MRFALGMVIIAMLLLACSQQAPICSAPYILQGGKCCLDANNDSVCDVKAASEKLDCSLCPPQFVTQKEQVIVYRYVCQNQSVMENPKDCNDASGAYRFNLTKEQDERYVEEFSLKPACRGNFEAGEVYLKYAQPPLNMTLQLLDRPDGEFENVKALEVKPETYAYVSYCRDCQNLIDVQLREDHPYVIRAALTYEKFTLYTRELVVDPTDSGDIGKKICS